MDNSRNLSIIIITRNEELDVEACLLSVKRIANEIVVVDSGSTDKTLEIAKRYTEKVYHRDWDGFSNQKQYALERVQGPWVLNLDADERVSKELEEEIMNLLHSDHGRLFNGYQIPFWHFFCGDRLRFGSGHAERHIRLFRKDQAHYGSQSVHEGIVVTPPIGSLQHPIYHYSYRDIHDYLGKCNHYTTLIAREKYSHGQKFHWWHHLRLPWEFFLRYILKFGWLDGRPGFIYALLSSYYVWIKYVKLRDLEVQKR